MATTDPDPVRLDNDTRLTRAEELAAEALELINAVQVEMPIGARGPHGSMVCTAFDRIQYDLDNSVRLTHWLRESA